MSAPAREATDVFEGYVCWEQPNLQAVAEIDAGARGHLPEGGADAVFLATHQPTPMRKGGTGSGALVSEADLLRDFRSPLGNNPHLLFVVGRSGTGKSHIVKWLQTEIGDHPDWHEVYIEKRNTSLHKVIETILEGLEGPRIMDLKDRLAENARSLRTVAEAKHKLLLELAFLVETADPAAKLTGPDGTVFDPQFVSHLQKHLSALLLDPVPRTALLRAGAAVERITRLAFEGATGLEDVDERALQLTEEDLPLQPEDLVDAGKAARDIIRDLSMNTKFRHAALAMLNQHLAAAKAQVFMGKGVDLVAVFEEVRRELAKRDLELCLFIEDLVVLHGIDQELAHVLTIPRGAKGSLCGLRAAIAVTDGYLLQIDTFKTRGVRYSLDLELGTDLPEGTSRSFVARYLNAARHGPELLAEARREGGADGWVPNRCTPRYCGYVDECHATFGSSEEGYGYYPYNRTAVDRLVRLASPNNFDPRSVIREVIRDPMEVASEELPAPSGAFPSGRFAATLDAHRENVDSGVKLALERRRDPEAARRISLLSFWNGGADTLVNLAEGIHAAFRLPALPDIGVDVEDEGEDAGGGVSGGGRVAGKKVLAGLAEIEKWSVDKATLGSGVAGIIRQTVLEGLIQRLQLGASGVRITPGVRSRWRVGSFEIGLHTVAIEDSQGGGELDPPFQINLRRSPRSAVLFKNILLAQDQGSWALDNDGNAYADFIELVSRRADDLLRVATKSKGVDVGPAFEVLAVCTRMKGDLPDAIEDLPAALLAPLVGSAERSAPWAKLRAAADAARRAALAVLRDELSAAKGRGAPSLLDVAPVFEVLARAGRIRQLQEPLTGTEDLVSSQRALLKAQQEAAAAEWTRISRILEQLKVFLSDDDRWDDLQKTVAAAVDEAQGPGFLPRALAREDLAGRRDAVDSLEVERYKRLLRDRPSPASVVPAEALWGLVPDPTPGLEQLYAYLLLAYQFLEYAQRRIDEKNSGAGGGGVAVSSVVDELKSLGDLLDTLAREG
jgi:hypothetical protein